MADFPRSPCPIARSLDLIGDKWTMVILRDLLTGKSRYSEFLASPERITTNILADRLERMETSGLILRQPYQDRPVRYEYRLTEKGRGLHPTLRALCRWANEFMPGTWTPPPAFMADEDNPQSS
jgi:DNA-binding HxlR family transcriptional regulator